MTRPDAFIHGIINAMVWFTDKMRHRLRISVDNSNGTICTATVDNDKLNIFVGLTDNGTDRPFYDV